MKIQILQISKSTPPGKSYQQLEISYKNLDTGAVAAKKLMPFGGNKATFDKLTGATQNQVFSIEQSKNDAGYWDWVGCSPSSADTPSETPKATQVKSTYETPEERAKKQIYIIRQSSLSHAISVLSVGAKSPPPSDAVFALAESFAAWVTQNPLAQDVFQLPNDLEVQ